MDKDITVFHTFGDSHSSFHGGWTKIKIKNFKILTNHFGGKTMSFFSSKNITDILKTSHIDIICLCYGEIDCRVHINKFEPNYESRIDEIVTWYFNGISNIRKLYNNIKICVYNVVPPVAREKEENKWMESGSASPAAGTDIQRKKYTLYMNKKLKEYCILNNCIFFDVYNKYVDNEGFLNPVYSDQNCHISDPIYLTEFINQNLI